MDISAHEISTCWLMKFHKLVPYIATQVGLNLLHFVGIMMTSRLVLLDQNIYYR